MLGPDDQIFLRLDPELARKTRVSHWFLFVITSLLVVPAGFFFYVFENLIRDPGGHVSWMWDLLSTAIFVSAGTEVLAWSLLGLLFFKRSFPLWHRIVWMTVLLFGSVTGAISLYLASWDSDARVYLLLFGFFCFLIVVLAARNLVLAYRSLKKIARKGPEPPLDGVA